MQIESLSTTTPTSKDASAEGNKEEFPPTVEAMESTFRKIQNDYAHFLQKGESKEDYKERMKVHNFCFY